MRIGGLVGSTVVFCTLVVLTGCGTVHGRTQAQIGGQRLPAGVVEALPDAVASPAVDLDIAPVDWPPVIQAVYDGKSKVSIAVRSRWRGRVVTLYYLPRYNLLHQGNHYQLRSAKRVQRIGQYPIYPNGHWDATWTVGSYPIPPHKPLYLLAITDAGQVGLVQIDTL